MQCLTRSSTSLHEKPDQQTYKRSSLDLPQVVLCQEEKETQREALGGAH